MTISSSVTTPNSSLVLGYTNGTTKALDNTQRLSVLYWKTGKDGVKKDSKSVSIPKLVGLTPDELQQMIPHCLNMLVMVQNKIIRELVDGGKNAIGYEDISVKECLKYLEESASDGEGNSVRLTKESIGEWFKSNLEDKLMLALSAKLGIREDVEPTNEQCELVENTTNAFKARIISLASGTVKLDIKTATSVMNAVKISNDNGDSEGNDVIYDKLIARLGKMMEVKKDEIDLIDVL